MGHKQVLVDVGPGETRVALMEDGRLAELFYERALRDDETDGPRQADSCLGDIFLGRVKRVLPGMQAAFVDLGLSRGGFLSAREAQNLGPRASETVQPINALVQEGQALLVQVIKESIGDKGPRLTAAPTLPGRLLILIPGQETFALSRRITDEAARARLEAVARQLGQDGRAQHGLQAGFIVRTSALDATEAELAQEAERLFTSWLALQAKAAEGRAPVRLYHELGPIARVLRDHVDAQTEQVWINDAAAYGQARAYAAEIMPQFAACLRLARGQAALFETEGVEAEIEALLAPRVPLPSGGWITLEMTEALTAIDVNSGRLEASGLEETGFTTNLEAAREIGRQLRLRGIGGLIVIDFIHMAEEAHNEAVLAALRDRLAQDRVPVQMSGLSVFGLVELTRKRVGPPLIRLLTDKCGACDGQARLLSAGTLANEVLRQVLAAASAGPPVRGLRLRVAPEIAVWLEARRQGVLEPLAARLGRTLRVEPVAGFARVHYEVTPLETAP